MNQVETVFELNWLSVELVTNSAKHREDPHIRQPRGTLAPESAPGPCSSEAHSARKSRRRVEGKLTEENPNGGWISHTDA